MKTAKKHAHFEPSVLSNSISWANQEEKIPVLSLVTGAQNKVSDEPEAEDSVRIPDPSTCVSGSTGVKGLAEMESWLKLRQPARTIPTLSSSRSYKVEQLLPDGSTVTLTVRRRVKGNQPNRLLAIGETKSSNTLQVLPTDKSKARSERSEEQRNSTGGKSNVKTFAIPYADTQALDQFIEEQAYDAYTMSMVSKLVEKQHQSWCNFNGGSTIRERLDFVKTVESADAAAEDSNIDEFRNDAPDGELIGTKSYTQWEASRHSALEKERARAEHEVALVLERRDQAERLRYNRALKKGTEENGVIPSSRLGKRTTDNPVAVHANAVSLLSVANRHQSADEERYKLWLADRDTYNPIIESSRISYIGKWLGHMSLNGKAHEVVGNMKRLNDERNAHRNRNIQAQRDHYENWWATVELKGTDVYVPHDSHVVEAANDADYVAKKTGAATRYRSPIISSFSASVEESVLHQRMVDAIAASPMAVLVNGEWVRVTREAVQQAFAMED